MREGASPAQPRVLRRNTTDKVLGGVCGGLGRYLGVDPVVLRVAFVVLALSAGGGVLLYLVAWIVIPEERPGEALGEAAPSSGDATRLVVGGVLIAIGTILLLNLAIPRIGRYVWPLALVAAGVGIVVHAMSRR